MDFDAPVQFAGADPLGPLGDRPDRAGHAAGDDGRHQGRCDQPEEEQPRRAHRRAVERREGFGERHFDKHPPADRGDRGMRGQHTASGEVLRERGRPRFAALPRRRC